MTPKVNYVITTWSGPRRVPNLNYLKNHLINLLTIKHNLSQITIVKPIVEGCNMSYYEIDSLINKFNCDVKILEKYDNMGQSYGQFFHAYETYKNEFDYYIFVEDDYMVDIDHFDKILVDEFVNQEVDGFLCSYCGPTPTDPVVCASISNGVISTNCMSKIYDIFPNPIQKINSIAGYMCQINFSKLIWESNLHLKDISKKYRVPYFGDYVIEYGRTDTDESIFIPHQLFQPKIKFRPMVVDDLSDFLEIRNLSKEFLHNNSSFTLDQATIWFNKDKPKFYIIELGETTIGYFRTSNWESTIGLYIGCDIHPDFRGFGLGYLSYVKFIKKLYDEFNVQTISLEVLETNTRALNLYTKLGFEKVGISDEKIIRDGNTIDSIFMSLDKKTFLL
jgi:RimJ/RimL family protein N-acetyltransferase